MQPKNVSLNILHAHDGILNEKKKSVFFDITSLHFFQIFLWFV